MPLAGETQYFSIPKEANSTGIADARTFNAAMDWIDSLLASGAATGTWKTPVDVVGDLPLVDPIATARVVKADGLIYVWNGTSWIPSNQGALIYQGTWNAATNTPSLSDSTGVMGNYYVVSTGGSQDLGSGLITFSPGDWVVHNDIIWEKADHTDVVTSVFGRQGAVIAVAGDYAASQVTNDSTVAGAFVNNALDWLKTAPPNPHKDLHKFGGTDAFLATDLLDAVVRRLRETGGPTDLLVGAVPDGSGLKRVGTSIIGDPGMAYRCWSTSFGSSTSAGFNTSSATPVVMRMKIFPGSNLFSIPMRACIIAKSSSGNAGYADIYRPGTGTVIATIGPITATTPTLYEFTPPWTNLWPTTEEIMEIRVYRGGAAATITVYDICAGVY